MRGVLENNVFLLLGFTSCKAKKPLQGMKLQEKEEKDEKHIGKLFIKNPKIKGVN